MFEIFLSLILPFLMEFRLNISKLLDHLTQFSIVLFSAIYLIILSVFTTKILFQLLMIILSLSFLQLNVHVLLTI